MNGDPKTTGFLAFVVVGVVEANFDLGVNAAKWSGVGSAKVAAVVAGALRSANGVDIAKGSGSSFGRSAAAIFAASGFIAGLPAKGSSPAAFLVDRLIDRLIGAGEGPLANKSAKANLLGFSPTFASRTGGLIGDGIFDGVSFEGVRRLSLEALLPRVIGAGGATAATSSGWRSISAPIAVCLVRRVLRVRLVVVTSIVSISSRTITSGVFAAWLLVTLVLLFKTEVPAQ